MLNSKNLQIVFAFAILTFLPSHTKAASWAVDIQTGSALNLPAPLTLSQGAYQKSLTADYSTRAWGGGAAPYYNIRVRKYRESNTTDFWSFELLHHKLWLDNLPPEVDEFRMTFGYNPLLFSYGRTFMPWLRAYAGLGPVFAHPKNTVNGKKLPDEPKVWPTGHRYVFVGWALQSGAEAFYNLNDNVFINFDLKLVASHSWRIPLVDGSAKTTPCSFHFNFGVGYEW